jgi:hypothetical protein
LMNLFLSLIIWREVMYQRKGESITEPRGKQDNVISFPGSR